MMNFFIKKKFLTISQFFHPKEIYEIIYIVEYLKTYNELSKTSNNWGNNYIVNTRTPKKRVQTFFAAVLDNSYIPSFIKERHKQKYKKINSIIMEHFTFISCLFKINLLPKISTLIYRLYGNINWKITRITSMDIFPGSEEQEIHLDGNDVGNTKELYLMIPLIEHDENIGGTIFYDNEIVKKYKKENKMNFGYFENLKGEMRKDFKKARIFNPPHIGDITIHTNETIHAGAENKSNRIRKIIFLIITVGCEKDVYMTQPMTILKCMKTNYLSLTIPRNEREFKKTLEKDNLKIIDSNKYISQYNILPPTFATELYDKGLYIMNNDVIKNQATKFINLIKDIEKYKKNNNYYKIWINEGFSGNPYILHDKREMLELYQIEHILKVTTDSMNKFGEKFGEKNEFIIKEMHFKNMRITYNIMLPFMPLIFNITQKLNYKYFKLANVKYYKILPGGKDQQLHCDGTFPSNDGEKGDNLYLIYSLQDTTIDMGGTNYYLNNKLNDKWKYINSNKNKCIGFIENLKDKNMFYKRRIIASFT